MEYDVEELFKAVLAEPEHPMQYLKKKFPPYKSCKEALIDLAKIKPADLSSQNTSKEDAFTMLKSVMIVLGKCTNINLSSCQHEVSSVLKKIGCVTYNKADKKFVTNQTLCSMMRTKNGTAFPILAVTQLIDSTYYEFEYGFHKLVDEDGGASRVHTWLDAQEEKERTR